MRSIILKIKIMEDDLTSDLLNATRWGYTDKVAILIKYGAAVNARDDYGATDLMIAAQKGYTDTAHC